MSTNLQHRNCPACGSDRPADEVHSEPRGEKLAFEQLREQWWGVQREKVFLSYARCGECGLMYAPTYFTDAQLSELYADMAPNMDGATPRELAVATQRGYWQSIKKVAPMDGGFLEVGPDIGYIVADAVREAAYDHYWLFEPNRAVHAELAAATAGKPHTISTDMNDLSPVPDASVGVAVMIHVLDHLLDPMAILRQVHAKLKPGGVLAVVTHNEGSTLRRVMGTRFPPFCLQHPELYNPGSMTNVLTRAGYARVDVARSKNYFPIDFMIKQAAFTFGVKIEKLPLPKLPLGLKLGNMITVATKA